MERIPHTVVITIALFVSSIASAQRLYMQAYGTWQQPIGGLSSANVTSTLGPTSYTSKRESVMLNFGKGPGGGLLLGGRLCGAFSWETRFTYMSGATNKSGYASTNSGYGTLESKLEQTCDFLGVEPALRMNMGDSTHHWYMAFGPSFAFMPRLIERYEDTNVYSGPSGNFSSVRNETVETTGGIGWGAFGAIGYQYQCKGRLGFFVELNGTARSWAPARSKTTKYTVDGVDMVDNLNTSERETEYEDEFTETDPQDPDKPSKSTRINLPMSSFGVRAGLQLVLVR